MRSLIVALLIVVFVCLVSAVWLGRHQDSSNAIANQSPANAGHAAALSSQNNLEPQTQETKLIPQGTASLPAERRPSPQLFAVKRHCHNLLSKRKNISEEIEVCKRSNNPDDSKHCQEVVPTLQSELASVDSELQGCSPVAADVEHAYFVEAKDAARNGDVDAQLCYLQGNFRFGNGLPDKEVDDYKAASVNYVNLGIERGDWRVIQLLGERARNFHRPGPYLRRELTDGGPYIVYQMNRLLRLGATGDYASTLDIRAASLRAELTPDDVAKADSWANSTFEHHFQQAPSLTEAPKTCDDN